MTQKPAALNRNLGIAAIVVWLEAAVVAAFSLFLIYGFFTTEVRSVASELALCGLYIGAAAWLIYVGRSLRQGKRWARSGAIFWQTCQIFLASQSFTGRSANAFIGGYLLITALVVLALLFSKQVLADSKREIESDR